MVLLLGGRSSARAADTANAAWSASSAAATAAMTASASAGSKLDQGWDAAARESAAFA